MKVGKLIRIGVLLLVVPVLSGCWLLAVGGAGAYGGYKMKEKGYTVENPIKKGSPRQCGKRRIKGPMNKSYARTRMGTYR